MPMTLPVPVSWTSAIDVFAISSLCRLTYSLEPCSPCSSPVNSTKRMVRLGGCRSWPGCGRLQNHTAAGAVVGRALTEIPRIEMAPTTTNSSGLSAPRISPTVL